MRLLGKREVAFLSSIYDSQRKFRGKREKPFFNPSKLIGFINRLVSKIFSGNRVWYSDNKPAFYFGCDVYCFLLDQVSASSS